MPTLPPKLQHQLQQLQQLRSSNPRLFYAGAGAAAVLMLLLISIFSGSSTKTYTIAQPTSAPASAAPARDIKVDERTLAPLSPEDQNVLALFNPSDIQNADQRNETTVTQHIERALTLSFVLTRCNLLSQDDYTNTYYALVRYAQQGGLATDQASADQRVRQIAESANASYSLVYGRTKCTDPELSTSADQLAKWVRGIPAQ